MKKTALMYVVKTKKKKKTISKATFTDLRNLMRNFSTFSLACLFYFSFCPKTFVQPVNGKINKGAKKLTNFALNFADR